MRFLYLSLALVCACGDHKEEDASTGSGCVSQSDCADGTVCLAYGDEETGSCALECNLSADECSAEASCAGVGSVSVSACQDEDRVAEDGAPPDEDDRPRLTCDSDDDCTIYDSAAVCAEYRGLRECALSCTTDAECNPPEIGGVTTTFQRCGQDDAADRLVCLPNEACWSNPASCIQLSY